MSLVLGASVPAMAQSAGDDVTDLYIVNAGFDEDLTFQPDGTMKDIVSTTTSLSDRSWAYIAADSTLYARPKSTSNMSRPDGRKMDAVNGFVARIKGWTVVPKTAFPACEWVYFGAVPYDLEPTAVPKSDNTNGFLTVPERPADFDTEDNVGFMFLSCGWTNACSYKQEVQLPTAQYRLEYWTKNFNPNGTATATDLSNVKFRSIVVRDESGQGLTSQEWIKHEIEFVPIGSVTMEFGYESANSGSNSNPFVAIDGIRLIYMGEADELEVLKGDFYELYQQVEETVNNDLGDYYGVNDELLAQLQNLSYDVDDATTVEQLQTAIAQLTTLRDNTATIKAQAEAVAALLVKAHNIADNGVEYPGYLAFTDALGEFDNVLQDGTVAEIEAAAAAINAAIEAYFQSQEATLETPANYTYLVQHPWFCTDGREPFSADAADVSAAALQDSDKDATGWTDGSTASNRTTGAWFNVGRTCYQLWATNFTGYLDVHQELTGLPNGIYSVQADLITNANSLNDQHVYATSSLGNTEGYMTSAGVLEEWPSGAYAGSYPGDGTEPWETVVAEGTVIVVDGKLTIGARSTHSDSEYDVSVGGRGGCFWVTNFVLRYHGEATPEQIAEATKAIEGRAQELMAGMHFAADKAQVADSIAAYNSTANLDVLNAAIALAETSEAKYAEVYEPGKTLPTVADSLANYGSDAYGVAHEIVAHANAVTQAWLTSKEATYTKIDSLLSVMKGYTVTYADALVDVNGQLATIRSEKAMDLVLGIITAQETALIVDPLLAPAKVDSLVEQLNRAMAVAVAQNRYEQNPEAVDYTDYIINPDAAAEDGWVLEKGKGDKNTTAGQHYSGDSARRYFDSYNSTDSVLNFYGYQRIDNLPNGTYIVRAAVRTNAMGAFLFTSNGGEAKADTVFTEIPMQYFTEKLQDNTDTVVVASDIYGAIWEDAMAAYNSGIYTDDDYNYAFANGGVGRGWMWLTLPAQVVDNHSIVIGMTTDVARTGVQFEGKWFSVTDWSLTLESLGDNSGWDGPISGVSSVPAAKLAGNAVYDLQGRRVSAAGRGVFIIVNNGVARKVVR